MKTIRFLSFLIPAFCFASCLNAEAACADISIPCECIDPCCAGLPNISARLNPECRDFNVFASLIVWTVREAGADCWAEVITTSSSTFSNDLREVDFDWDPGYRVGISYGMMHDQWDTQAYYTWFKTTGKDHVSSLPGAVHSTFLGNFYIDNQDGKGLSGPSYQEASIQWTIHFNMFDWELGRNFWVSNSLAIRPFVGVKGGWIDQSIHSKWQDPALSATLFFNTGTENLKNNFWGIGPAAGINTRWNLFNFGCHSFDLFGDFSGAIMWGHWTFGDLFKNDIDQVVSVDLNPIKSGASMLRTFMGFSWKAFFSQNRTQFSAKLGYEMQFWLDQLQFYSFVGGRLNNELTLQGGTLEFCFDF
ncbi:MAG TPA: Lpg1974 family pore-forming outer membrane protein [Rhabdochlamydiaceae bacterium]|nr:Lpg1974 family pore-forming outer membrane protein [Rhabdochlamydiaceae bacterium]